MLAQTIWDSGDRLDGYKGSAKLITLDSDQAKGSHLLAVKLIYNWQCINQSSLNHERWCLSWSGAPSYRSHLPLVSSIQVYHISLAQDCNHVYSKNQTNVNVQLLFTASLIDLNIGVALKALTNRHLFAERDGKSSYLVGPELHTD